MTAAEDYDPDADGGRDFRRVETAEGVAGMTDKSMHEPTTIEMACHVVSGLMSLAHDIQRADLWVRCLATVEKIKSIGDEHQRDLENATDLAPHNKIASLRVAGESRLAQAHAVKAEMDALLGAFDAALDQREALRR